MNKICNFLLTKQKPLSKLLSCLVIFTLYFAALITTDWRVGLWSGVLALVYASINK